MHLGQGRPPLRSAWPGQLKPVLFLLCCSNPRRTHRGNVSSPSSAAAQIIQSPQTSALGSAQVVPEFTPRPLLNQLWPMLHSRGPRCTAEAHVAQPRSTMHSRGLQNTLHSRGLTEHTLTGVPRRLDRHCLAAGGGMPSRQVLTRGSAGAHSWICSNCARLALACRTGRRM